MVFIKFVVQRASKQDQTLHMEGKLHGNLNIRAVCSSYINISICVFSTRSLKTNKALAFFGLPFMFLEKVAIVAAIVSTVQWVLTGVGT